MEDRFLTNEAICSRYSISRQTIYKWTRDPNNDFPRPIHIGSHKRGGKRAWRESELVRWEQKREAESAR